MDEYLARALQNRISGHTYRQTEEGWVWHQGCKCGPCQDEHDRIAAEQRRTLAAVPQSADQDKSS